MYPIRGSVRAQLNGDALVINHPGWSLEVQLQHPLPPADAATISLKDLVARKECQPVLEFLEQQALWDYSALAASKQLQPEQTVQIVKACCNDWYGCFFSHPWWSRLAHGVATERLRQWVIHNYNLSKLASASSSRAASLCPEVRRTFYIQSIVEEYDHHARYFSSGGDSIGLMDPDPAPGALVGIEALGEYLVGLAERDELALLIFYYFQEASAELGEFYRVYYSKLSRTYSLPGFFEPWLAHVGEDGRLGHGSAVRDAVLSYGCVDPNRLKQALLRAWMCICLLIADLDSLAGQNQGAATVRPCFNDRSFVERVCLAGLSSSKDSSSIVAFGRILASVTSGALARELGGDIESESDWFSEVQAVMASYFTSRAELFSRLLSSPTEVERELEGAQLLASLLRLEPPDLFSGGPYSSSSKQ